MAESVRRCSHCKFNPVPAGKLYCSEICARMENCYDNNLWRIMKTRPGAGCPESKVSHSMANHPGANPTIPTNFVSGQRSGEVEVPPPAQASMKDRSFIIRTKYSAAPHSVERSSSDPLADKKNPPTVQRVVKKVISLAEEPKGKPLSSIGFVRQSEEYLPKRKVEVRGPVFTDSDGISVPVWRIHHPMQDFPITDVKLVHLLRQLTVSEYLAITMPFNDEVEVHLSSLPCLLEVYLEKRTMRTQLCLEDAAPVFPAAGDPGLGPHDWQANGG